MIFSKADFSRRSIGYTRKTCLALCILLFSALHCQQAKGAENALSIEVAIDAYNQQHWIQAISIFKTLAEQHDPLAETYLGQIYDQGNGVKADRIQAREWYLKAGTDGSVSAQLWLGNFYSNQFDRTNYNFAKAEHWLTLASDSGDSEGKYQLAELYANLSTTNDSNRRSRAVQLYIDAYDLGSTDAAIWLSGYYLDGGKTIFKNLPNLQIAPDNTLHMRYAIAAATGGNIFAMYLLARYYADETGENFNSDEAIKWYTKAANASTSDFWSGMANESLGVIYKNGTGVSVDLSKAFSYFLAASNMGIRSSFFEVAYAYDFGKGVAENKREAAHFYQLALDHREKAAGNNLALLYENGEGVTQDFAKALSLLRKAAVDDGKNFFDQNADPMSQVNLGRFYFEGKGIPQNYLLAYMWVNIGIANLTNKDNLEFAKELRERITSHLSQSQLLRGQAMTNRCLSSGYKDCNVIP
jgi:uncharacterized protein